MLHCILYINLFFLSLPECHISSICSFKVRLATLFLSKAGLQLGSSIAAFLFFVFCSLNLGYFSWKLQIYHSMLIFITRSWCTSQLYKMMNIYRSVLKAPGKNVLGFVCLFLLYVGILVSRILIFCSSARFFC